MKIIQRIFRAEFQIWKLRTWRFYYHQQQTKSAKNLQQKLKSLKTIKPQKWFEQRKLFENNWLSKGASDFITTIIENYLKFLRDAEKRLWTSSERSIKGGHVRPSQRYEGNSTDGNFLRKMWLQLFVNEDQRWTSKQSTQKDLYYRNQVQCHGFYFFLNSIQLQKSQLSDYLKSKKNYDEKGIKENRKSAGTCKI